MDARRKAAALDGLLAALSFLVLAQGYRLVTGRGVGPLALLGVAVLVGVVAAGLRYLVAARLGRNERV